MSYVHTICDISHFVSSHPVLYSLWNALQFAHLTVNSNLNKRAFHRVNLHASNHSWASADEWNVNCIEKHDDDTPEKQSSIISKIHLCTCHAGWRCWLSIKQPLADQSYRLARPRRWTEHLLQPELWPWTIIISFGERTKKKLRQVTLWTT